MDFEKLQNLKHTLGGQNYIEYIYHRFFDNPLAVFDPKSNATWQYPECWLARYHCYYELHKHILNNAKILDLGANLNHYSAWALLNGARHIDCVEPDTTRFNLGQEYLQLRDLDKKSTTSNLSIDQYISQYQGEKYDIVFLLDVLYYLTNAVNIVEFIAKTIKPKFLFLESTVVDDYDIKGHFEVWHPSTNSRRFQYYSSTPGPTDRMAMTPSRNALNALIAAANWEIVFYYDYHDFIGHGESPPRKQGKKNFYVLKNLNLDIT
jgi:2-polyprenyl-3-methyl-5-hydroxy-6-metoxy-1,4-benzoquinol methylase